MKMLIVTEKCGPEVTQRDGGAQLVATLRRALGDQLDIMQFGDKCDQAAKWHFQYPTVNTNRFSGRIENASFIAKKVAELVNQYSSIIFVHVSMAFGVENITLPATCRTIIFPMFLSKSYQLSGEEISDAYRDCELKALKLADLIITPGLLEKQQLVNDYFLSPSKIRVIPRGVNISSKTRRALSGTMHFCSIGSIKPQKNTLALIDAFSCVVREYGNVKLTIIGPVQCDNYYHRVKAHINALGISHLIDFTGYVFPENLAQLTQHMHFHISLSCCETFGRSIFESLALGLPNIVKKENNAAASYLVGLPYVKFITDVNDMVTQLKKMICDYDVLTMMATEIGEIYDEMVLSRLLAAEIIGNDVMAISDYDGTLYHKNNQARTLQSISAFQQFSKRVICTARGIDDLLSQLNHYQVNVDWIISYGGALIADGNGKVHWTTPLKEESIEEIRKQIPLAQPVLYANTVMQLAIDTSVPYQFLGLRTEHYCGRMYIANWSASKLRAIIRLLNHIDHHGCVRVFGDGQYDQEMLTYFDGNAQLID